MDHYWAYFAIFIVSLTAICASPAPTEESEERTIVLQIKGRDDWEHYHIETAQNVNGVNYTEDDDVIIECSDKDQAILFDVDIMPDGEEPANKIAYKNIKGAEANGLNVTLSYGSSKAMLKFFEEADVTKFLTAVEKLTKAAK